MSKAPAVFDMVKLAWMNGEYLKKMDLEDFLPLATPYLKEVITKELDLRKIAELVKTRIELLPQIKDHIDFFEELPDYDVAIYTHKKMKTNSENSLEVLKEILEVLKDFNDWTVEGLHDKIMEYIKEKGIKNGQGLWPIKTAVSGKQSSPGGAFEIMDILGKDESLRRIQIGIEKLEAAV